MTANLKRTLLSYVRIISSQIHLECGLNTSACNIRCSTPCSKNM